MNRLYRTVWSNITETFVAVAENVKRRRKRSGVCQRVALDSEANCSLQSFNEAP